MTLRARNALGTAEQKFRIVVGDRLGLDAPHGLERPVHLGNQGDRQVSATRPMSMSPRGMTTTATRT